MDGGLGAGVFPSNIDTSLSVPLEIHASVFQAEVLALKACCEREEIEELRRQSSDTSSHLRALKSCSVSSGLD